MYLSIASLSRRWWAAGTAPSDRRSCARDKKVALSSRAASPASVTTFSVQLLLGGEEGVEDLVPLGAGATIVENDAHDRFRRRSTTAHEMAHWVREHPFTVALMAAEYGCGIADRRLEAEATELAGQLLIPTTAAVRLAHRGATNQDVAELYDVSLEMARWRLDSTGARKIAQRTAARRR